MSNNQNSDLLSDSDLEALFKAARDDAPLPSAGLLGRIAADATALQPPPVEMPKRLSWWRRAVSEIGGVPAMGGLVASACAGVYFGFANPDMTTGFWTSETAVELSSDAVLSDPLLGDFVAMMVGVDA